MGKNKEKQSFFKKWAHRIGLALGLTASTLALGTRDANANEILVEDKNNTPVTDTVKADAVSNATLEQSNLDKLIAENNQILAGGTKVVAKSGLDKVIDAGKQISNTARETANVASSIQNLGRNTHNISNSSSINSAINNVKSAQNAWDRTTDSINKVDQNIFKTNQAVSQVLSTKDVKDKNETIETKVAEVQQLDKNNSTIEKVETTIISNDNKEKVSSENFETMSDNELLAKDIINHTHFRAIKYNPIDKEDLLSDEIVSLKQKAGEARYNQNDELAHFLELKINDLEKERIALTEARLSGDYEPEIAVNSYEYKSRAITPKKVDELTAFATNVPDNLTPGQTLAHYSNGLIDLNLAIEGFIKNNNPETYSISDRENYYSMLSHLLQVYVRTENKALAIEKEIPNNLENPDYKIEFTEQDVKPIEKTYTTPSVSDVPHIRKTKPVTKNNNKTIFQNSSEVQVYNPSSEQADSQTVTSVKQDDSQIMQNDKTTTIDESKLADVSVGQMGIFDEEKEDKPKKEPGEIDLDALFNVSEGQMGIWNEIEDILDEDIAKNSSDKSKSSDDDLER